MNGKRLELERERGRKDERRTGRQDEILKD
jgi:hypothetical protein